MRSKVITVASLLLTCACAKSSTQLLEENDPKVCAKGDVIDQLSELIKQNAPRPRDNGYINNYQQSLERWISSISINLTNVSSENIDTANHNVTCNAIVHMQRKGGAEELSQDISYKIVADLSVRDKIVVSANTLLVSGMFSNLLDQVAAPDVKRAQQDEISNLSHKTDNYEKAWTQAHLAEISAKKQFIDSEYGLRFSPAERAGIVHSEVLDAQCFSTVGEERDLICKRQENIYIEMTKHNICQYMVEGKPWGRCNNINLQEDVSTNNQAQNKNTLGDCSILVDGVSYLNLRGTCPIQTADGTISLNTGSGPISYFAYINPNDDGTAQIFWNSKEKWDKADQDLGSDFVHQGACWVNARAKVCEKS